MFLDKRKNLKKSFYFGLSKLKIIPALPLTKIYLIIVIKKRLYLGSNRIALGGEIEILALCEDAPINCHTG